MASRSFLFLYIIQTQTILLLLALNPVTRPNYRKKEHSPSVLATAPSYTYSTYQTTIYCNASTPIQEPKGIDEIIQIVQFARSRRMKVKAFGSRHSLTDIICTDGIPISMVHIDSKKLNPDGTATFGAGIQLYKAMEFLETHKRSLIHLPTYGGITIGGAIGTGAHGSSLRHPTSLSDQIVRLTIINGDGSLLTIDSPEEVNKFRVHLGLLGIIVDVTFSTVPLFKMTVHNYPESEEILFDNIFPNLAYQFDMIQLWWFPLTSHVVIGTGNHTSANTPGNAHSNFIPEGIPALIAGSTVALELLHEFGSKRAMKAFEAFTARSLYTKLGGIPPRYSESQEFQNPATGYAWRLLSNICDNNDGGYKRCAWNNKLFSILPEESSMAFDISQFHGVMTMIKSVLAKYPASFGLVGIYIRFSKASPALMAISSSRTTFTVEWAAAMRINPFDKPKDGIAAYQLMLQEMVTNYGGRPHWAKNGLYYTTRKVIGKAFPSRRTFVEAMNYYDPSGTFGNKFGRRLRGISDDMDMDPLVKHCALQDYCICGTNYDCADSQTCERVKQFSICGEANS